MIIVALVVAALGLLAVVGITTKAYAGADEKTRSLLFHLAWVAAATLAVTLVLLTWIVMRWFRFRMRRLGGKSADTHFLNAWDEAGRRIAVPETDDVIETSDESAEDDLPGEIDDEEDEGEENHCG